MTDLAIICVDDEPAVLDSLDMEIKSAVGLDYIIEMAENGDDALEICEELLESGTEIALVISDYIMPGLKGDELLKRVHILSPKTLTIMLSGQAELEVIGNAIKYANLYRYIAKPWQTEDFRLTITKALYSYSQAQALAEFHADLEETVAQRTQELQEQTVKLAETNRQIQMLNEQLNSENLRMSAELSVSRQLQQMLLPTDSELSQIDDLDIAGFMEPADEVGGDYYDVLQDDGRVLLSIGDVTGHGLESGALAIMVQSAVRTLFASHETEPVNFFCALNQMVYHNAARMKNDKSLTLVLLEYQNGLLRLSGQHEEVIVVREGEVDLIDTVDLGFPIGFINDIANFVSDTKVQLNQGDVVVLYTDGITEAENIEGKFYGLERLCEVVKQNWQRTAQEILHSVIEDVKQFIGNQKVFDDITLLVLKRQ
ncbi:MAG: SpoIIE family protein phosphatase [Pseudomonadota bacterium]